MLDITISPDAAQELEEAAAWYEHRQAGLGRRLVDTFEHALKLLKEPNPPLIPIAGNAGRLGAKKLVLHKFPFSLIVTEIHNRKVVVAFAHHSRRPGYWKKRIEPCSK